MVTKLSQIFSKLWYTIGKTQPAECDELFAKKIAELETFAKDLLLVYGQEEKTLRVRKFILSFLPMNFLFR